MVTIDINCDMGESFGKWSLGRDEDVMPYITSANIAGGYHAGDPHVMHDTVKLAREHDVGLGIHPGFPDKIGFGRRRMDATPEELREYVIYQLGALSAFAEAHDARIQHVKPHGAMYSMLSESADHARAVMEGVRDVDSDLIYLATDSNIYDVAQDVEGLQSVFEGYVDLTYRSDRSLIVEQDKQEPDPELVADRFENIALNGEVKADNGELIDVPADSICIHGDTPNAVELLEAIHDRIKERDIELAPLQTVV